MVKKKGKDSRTTVLCRTCVSYYITYDTSAPYGCRALGFKSKKNPAAVVYEASGLQCQLYSPKKKKPTGGSGGGIVA